MFERCRPFEDNHAVGEDVAGEVGQRSRGVLDPITTANSTTSAPSDPSWVVDLLLPHRVTMCTSNFPGRWISVDAFRL
jgi:hypothetical protein